MFRVANVLPEARYDGTRFTGIIPRSGRCQSSKVNLAERNDRTTPMIQVIRTFIQKNKFPSANNSFIRPHLVY